MFIYDIIHKIRSDLGFGQFVYNYAMNFNRTSIYLLKEMNSLSEIIQIPLL